MHVSDYASPVICMLVMMLRHQPRASLLCVVVIACRCCAGVSVQYIIFDMSAVLHVDSAGCHAIEDILVDMAKHNITVILAGPSMSVLRQLELAGLCVCVWGGGGCIDH